MTVRAVLLDLDETLVDTPRSMRRAVSEAVRQHAGISDVDLLEAVADRWLGDPAGHFHRYETGQITFVEQRRARFDEIMALADTTDIDYVSWEATYVHLLARGVRAYDDVVPFLDALGTLPVAVVTNVATDVQRRKLEAAGLAERLPVVVGVDVAGAPKPDPAPFLHACALLGVDPSDALHVGDSLLADVQGALAAGLQAVWIDRSGDQDAVTPPVGARRVASLGEIPALLRSANASPTLPPPAGLDAGR